MLKFVAAFLLVISFSAKAQQPQLKGGLANFIAQNRIYPSYALHNCIQATITVQFRLNAKGEVYDAAISNGLGIDLDDEALRLIKLSNKKWIVPASHDTTAVLIVPVNFTLQGYDCERATKSDIAMAIKAYKDDEALTAIVTNYYKGKENGNVDTSDEPKIIGIKKDLGIDDEYLDEVVAAGQKKLKQGDKQGACKDFTFVKYMGSDKADQLLAKHCK
eukprot:Opistho-1_new@98048